MNVILNEYFEVSTSLVDRIFVLFVMNLDMHALFLFLRNFTNDFVISYPECLPIVTNVPKSTVVTQFDLIQSS